MATTEKPQENTTEAKTERKNGDGKWGYDLYPERKQAFKTDVSKIVQMKHGREYYDKLRCEESVYKCIKNSPLVKLMMRALRASGW